MKYSPLNIWVNTICIDQSNIVERNVQVGIMRDIYIQASNVLVWLGEETDDSHLALDLISVWGTQRIMHKFY
jgi:hypothetical protein